MDSVKKSDTNIFSLQKKKKKIILVSMYGANNNSCQPTLNVFFWVSLAILPHPVALEAPFHFIFTFLLSLRYKDACLTHFRENCKILKYYWKNKTCVFT